MATTIGILLGIILLSITMFMGGGVKVFFNPEAIMITLGGTIAATLCGVTNYAELACYNYPHVPFLPAYIHKYPT